MAISPEKDAWLDQWLAKRTPKEIETMQAKILELEAPNLGKLDQKAVNEYRRDLIALFPREDEAAVIGMTLTSGTLAEKIASLSAFKVRVQEKVEAKIAEKAKAEAKVEASAQATAAPATATTQAAAAAEAAKRSKSLKGEPASAQARRDSASAVPPPLPPKPPKPPRIQPLSGTAAGGAVPAAAEEGSKQPAVKARWREGTAVRMQTQQPQDAVVIPPKPTVMAEEGYGPVSASAPAGTKLVSASPSSPVERLAGITLQANSQKAQFASGPSGQPLTLQHNAQKAQPNAADSGRELTTANTNAAIETVQKKLEKSIKAYNNKPENKNANKKLDLVEYDNGTLEVYLNVGDKPTKRVYSVEPVASGVKITFDPITEMNFISAKIAIDACESPVKITQSNNLEDLQHLADAAVASGKTLELSPQVLAFLKNKPEFNDQKNAEKYKNLKAVYETHSGLTVDAKERARSKPR